MRIGLAVPALFSFSGPGNGVRVQADAQADALAALGHEVVRLNPWEPWDGVGYDVVQFFAGGFPLLDVEHHSRRTTRALVFAPMIDSNEPNWRYRLAAEADRFTKRFQSTPGQLRRQAHGSDLTVVRSRHEQDRLVHGLGLPRERTRVVLNGVTPPPPADPTSAHALLGSDTPFVLHVGAYCDPRKNTVRLIEAVGPTGLPLVIAGTTFENPVLDRIRVLEKQYPNVRRLPYVPAGQLHALYAACRVLALPSLHEGTGLVALEAAAYGAAVVITDHGGPRDYFLDHAHYVNPYDVRGITDAVAAAMAGPPGRALRDHVLSNLTWANSARQLTDAYAAALHGTAAATRTPS